MSVKRPGTKLGDILKRLLGALYLQPLQTCKACKNLFWESTYVIGMNRPRKKEEQALYM